MLPPFLCIDIRVVLQPFFAPFSNDIPIFGGGRGGILAKDLAEIAGGRETAFGSNFGDGAVVVPEIFSCRHHPIPHEIGGGGPAEGGGKQLVKIGRV